MKQIMCGSERSERWKGKAIDQYEKFLDLWKNADPGKEEVEDAKIAWLN